MRNGRPRNSSREIAVEFGLLTYEGRPHFRCGTTTRYVVGAGCVHCARAIATEQREARKYLRQRSINEAEEMIARHDDVVLDIAPADGLDAGDAEARRQAAIDELM